MITECICFVLFVLFCFVLKVLVSCTHGYLFIASTDSTDHSQFFSRRFVFRSKCRKEEPEIIIGNL